MVGLTGFNLNSDLTEYIGVINTAMSLGPQKMALPHLPQKWRLRDKLSGRDIIQLVMAFETGIATKELAERYQINIKSVRMILHAEGASVLRRHKAG